MSIVLSKTPLHSIHEREGAKFGPFAGYEMPLFYKTGIMAEHLHTRSLAGLFDVSHMMHVEISGKDAVAAISHLCPLDPEEQQIGQAKYSFFLNEQAGIIDDLIVTRLGEDRFRIVCNAGCADKDWAHLVDETASFSVTLTKIPAGFMALQGPAAESVLERLGIDATELSFMQAKETGEMLVSRTGYTGEDGFEIALPEDKAPGLAKTMLADEAVLPVGLGARDSLRLEAGLSLYGQDLDEETTPMEAGLTWAIPAHIRDGGEFLGAHAFAAKRAEGRGRKRVGLKPEGRAPIRAEAPILDNSGQQIGKVTSGGFGPSVEHPVAIGMIATDADEASLVAEVRGKHMPLTVAQLPFVPHSYKR